MPLYYIHLRNGEQDVIDEEGHELPDLESARRRALKAAGEIIADEMAQGRESIRIVLIVESEDGERLLELPIAVFAG
ncbi:MAG TPA: hypothetical protein VIT45_06650 [Allosphingosinicella sp.]